MNRRVRRGGFFQFGSGPGSGVSAESCRESGPPASYGVKELEAAGDVCNQACARDGARRVERVVVFATKTSHLSVGRPSKIPPARLVKNPSTPIDFLAPILVPFRFH
jgi:hypothetical protein